MRHTLQSIVRPLRTTLTSGVGALTTLALLLTAPLPATATSGSPNIQVHLGPTTQKNPCTNFVPPACGGIVTRGLLYPQAYYAYVLVTEAEPTAGIGGAEFGISYDNSPGLGVEIYSWQACSSLEFASAGWPASNTGNLVTWDTVTRCQRFEPGGAGTGATAVCGYFYMAAYSRDDLRIIPRPSSGKARVANCSGIETDVSPSGIGWAAFSASGMEVGRNPCNSTVTCSIQGPEALTAGAPPQNYSLDPTWDTTSGEWAITDGPGQIIGPSSGPSVNVLALAPGIIGLRALSGSACGPEGCHGCSMSITVDAPTPAVRTTWSGIKAGFRAN